MADEARFAPPAEPHKLALEPVMRPVYRALSENEKMLIQRIKDEGEAFHRLITDYLPVGRETSIAKTKLEEAVMWATKAITA